MVFDGCWMVFGWFRKKMMDFGWFLGGLGQILIDFGWFLDGSGKQIMDLDRFLNGFWMVQDGFWD